MKDLYLIDASGYLFRAYYGLPPMSNPQGQATHAVFGFIRSLLRVIKDFQPTHLAAVFDAPGGKESRQAIYSAYKAHRGPAPDDFPQQVAWALEFCELQGIPVVSVPGVEADDAIGTITKHAAQSGAHVYVCTSDKDLYQLVGNRVTVINTFKNNLVVDSNGVKDRLGVLPEQVVDLLALMGDTSDNIPGVSGIGIKTAAALLAEFGSLESILANTDKIKGPKRRETLLQQADIARLSQQLAMLNFKVDCPTKANFYALLAPKTEKLRHFFRELGFHSLLKELVVANDAPELVTGSYQTVDDAASLHQLMQTLSKADSICFDTETSKLCPTQAELVGIGFGIQKGEAWYIPCNGQIGRDHVLAAIKPLFANPNIGFYGHNVKYDLHVLANHGIEVANVVFDTILASYLLNSQSRRHSLDALALHYFEKVMTPIKSLIGTGKAEISIADVPIEKVSLYCAEDVDYTIRLKELLAPQLVERKLANLLNEIELPLMKILLQMERTGIFVDVPYLHQLAESFHEEIATLKHTIYKLAGEPFKLNSPKQLSHILFDKLGIKPLKKTATGYSTNAEVLMALARDHPIAEQILRYRTVEKLRSTYVDALPAEVHPRTGRVHTTFLQYVAATGRLASQDPNLQNIPIRTPEGSQVRAAFCPNDPGWSFLSADYSQVELRILAHLSQDPTLVQAFGHNQDIHAHTASVVFDMPLAKVTSKQRYQAKAVNFGIIYGQQAYGLSRELDIDIQGAAQFIETYFDRYPNVRDYMESAKAEAHRLGKTTTISGRERLIPEISSRNIVQRKAAERLAINSPLQGTAADLIKLAMIRVHNLLNESGLRARLLLQIHDELLIEAPDEEMEALSQLVRQGMEGAMDLCVPLPVDISIGKNWKEC